ncbi:beta-ketoacyl synthase N-terminal-like domain-containing protein [Amycolatopsis sp. NPDC004079]|uniref:beta-ketoacyl synthase N-terminal-like domain-containing protein n=1 Tax=Amycolatopsis sp. NPDC004079 TaxID=3154549 RepID=UPI0033BD4C20
MTEDIAIIGMACRVPGAASPDALWRNLFAGIDPIRRYSDEELRAAGVEEALLRDPGLVRAVGHLTGIADFDAEFFGYSADEAAQLDPQHRLLLETSWSAFEDAGYDPASCPDTGVFASVGPSWYEHYRLAGAWPGAHPVGAATDHAAARVSYALGLSGPSLAVQSACSSSLVAVCLAAQNLADFRCDLALAGAAAIPYPARLAADDGLVSLSGRCRTFDADADGSVFGSGSGAVLLKRLADALDDGDAIHAVIRGWAINNDGDRPDYRTPSGSGQAAVVLEALRAAEFDAVSYVEAHGSGTLLGDALEVDALDRAFRLAGIPGCLLGSVKPAIGHLDGASGVVGLIKSALVARHGTVPPTAHFRRPNPHLPLSGAFTVNTEPVELAAPRRVGVSSFGLGGTNAHVLLEQPPPLPRPAACSQHLLVLSARSPQALATVSAQLRDHLDREPDLPLADVAFTLATGRRAWPFRQFEIVANGSPSTELANLGRLWTAGGTPDWSTVFAPGHRRVWLPTYPFERTRQWAKGVPVLPE